VNEDHTRRYRLQRRATAWLIHAPGLWLLYGERLPRTLRRANALAVVLTLVAIALAWLRPPFEPRALAALAALVTGHVLWGSYLTWRLPSRDEAMRATSPPPQWTQRVTGPLTGRRDDKESHLNGR
jgi:hypothetical protein